MINVSPYVDHIALKHGMYFQNIVEKRQVICIGFIDITQTILKDELRPRTPKKQVATMPMARHKDE